MKQTGYLLVTLFALFAFTVAGCVTINIYFPASAAEKAADKIIDEVWQSQGGNAPASAPPATDPANSAEKP